jgi:tetratricopeptide (TPR) repeat protein
MPPPFRRRTTKKEPRRSPGPTAALEERIEAITDRVQKADDNQLERVAALEEYRTLARAHEGETWFDAGAWSEDLADSYLASGRVDDAVRTISDATRGGHAAGAEMLCELAEQLMRSGYELQARPLWQQARAHYPDDVWVYVQAGIGYSDIGEHAGALEWLTTGLELALRTSDPESAVEQLRPLRVLPVRARAPVRRNSVVPSREDATSGRQVPSRVLTRGGLSLTCSRIAATRPAEAPDSG